MWFAFAATLAFILSFEKAHAGLRPIPLCTPFASVCSGSRLTPEQVGSRSFDPEGTDVTLSLETSGPWSENGIKIVTLTVEDGEGKSSSRRCFVRVKTCNQRFRCPASPDDAPVTVEPSLFGRAEIDPSGSNQLCTLVMVSADGSSTKLIGRSYEGNNWEPYAGKYASLAYNCPTRLGACTISLPPLLEGHSFNLVTYEYSVPFPRDEIARFLEQGTFGPTRQEIADFPGPAQWIKDQQRLPISSHRQFFRERATNYLDFPSSVSLTTTPCSKGARYRKFIITGEDRGGSRAHISISESSGQYLFSVRNEEVRSVFSSIVGEFNNMNVTYGPGR